MFNVCCSRFVWFCCWKIRICGVLTVKIRTTFVVSMFGEFEYIYIHAICACHPHVCTLPRRYTRLKNTFRGRVYYYYYYYYYYSSPVPTFSYFSSDDIKITLLLCMFNIFFFSPLESKWSYPRHRN